jgi:hypothetical protein
MSLFVDFIGLNTLIQDPVTSSQNYIGYPLGSNTSSYAGGISLASSGDYLVALNLHRNGPYGHPIFKQVRVSQNPLTRYQIANNVFSFVETPSREVVRVIRTIATQATGSITIATNVNQFDTITIGDGINATKTYTFKNIPVLPTEIQIGASAIGTLANVRTKIEADFNIEMSTGFVTTRTLTNKNKGSIANFALQSSFASGDNSISGFTGGKNASNNQIEYISSRYGDIRTFDEVPITSKYYPLQFLFGVGIDNERIENKEDLSIPNIERILLQNSFGNEIGHFVNDGINKYYNLSSVTEEDYEKIKEFYLNGGLDADDSPITTFEFMKYKETIFPREVNTYKAHVRQRTNYQNNYWRDVRSDRSEVASNKFGSTVSQSIWPLDATADWATRSTVTTGYTNGEDEDPGILQNNYSLVSDSLSLFSAGTVNAALRPAPYYTRLHTLTGSTSVVAPSGIQITETMGPIFQGTALWQAGEQAGKNPFYSSYDYFIEELRGKGKDFSVVPEFRISDHVETLLASGSQTRILDFFEVTGGLLSSNQSSEAAFYETYSTTDFLKHFAKIKKDHQDFVEPSTIKLTCKGLKKFLAYDSFYPAIRTKEMAEQFYSSYSNFIDLSEFKGAKGSSAIRNAFMNLFSPLYAPGTLYNSIKAGVACDYPLYTEKPPIIQDGDDYLVGDGSFDFRIPFEATVEPEKYLSNILLFNNEPHPSGNISASCFWDGNGDTLYKKMASNFCAETGEFFLNKSSFTTVASLEQSSPNFGQAVSGNTYAMRVKMYRSMDSARLSFSGSNGPYMPPQDYISGSGYARETITMYSRPSAFGPASQGEAISGIHLDSRDGYNFPFTPPYYHGQAWADIQFTATETKKYTVNEIVSNAEVLYYRADQKALSSSAGAETRYGPQANYIAIGSNPALSVLNRQAMQLNSSLNLFSRGQIQEVNLENDTISQPVQITTDVT